MFDPLVYWGAYKTYYKKSIGIIGINELSIIGFKLAKAMGHRVVCISNSQKHEEFAMKKGADAFVCDTSPESMANETGKLDLILNTFANGQQLSHYLPLLASEGVMV